MKPRIYAALLCGAALIACQQAKQVAADPAAATAAIEQQEAQWNRDYADKNIEGALSHYSEDATMMETGAVPKTAKAGIRESLAPLFADPAFKLTFGKDRIQIAQAGDMAYTRGHYTVTATDAKSGQPVTGSGTYLTVWQKQHDGGWRAVEDFVTTGPPQEGEKPSGG